jgi:hypothetical protein
VSHRTQITLTDEQYALLKRESARTGVALAELVRRAIARTYSPPRDDFEDALNASFGAWKDRDFDGLEYVRRIRGPGLGYRLLGDDRR